MLDIVCFVAQYIFRSTCGSDDSESFNFPLFSQEENASFKYFLNKKLHPKLDKVKLIPFIR